MRVYSLRFRLAQKRRRRFRRNFRFGRADGFDVEYKLAAPGNQAVANANALEGKAKSSGEDIITPLIEQAATMIMNVVSASKK